MGQTIQSEHAYIYIGGKPFNVKLPYVIFMHGTQNDHSVWGLQTRWFAHYGFSVLAVDLSGHGHSDGAPLETMEAMVDWVMVLVHAADVTQPVIVVDHSVDSPIALECASRYVDRVRRIILVTTAWPMKVSDALPDAVLNDTASVIEMVNTRLRSSLTSKPSLPGPGFWIYGDSQRLMERVARGTRAPVFHTDSAACSAYAHGTKAMAFVKCPSLMIVGKEDQTISARAGHHVTAGLAGSYAVGLSGGHAIMGKCPDGALDALVVFACERGAVATQDAS